jgi:hypothetical protein
MPLSGDCQRFVEIARTAHVLLDLDGNDNPLTFTRLCSDTPHRSSGEAGRMSCFSSLNLYPKGRTLALLAALAALSISLAGAQNVPAITGGIGFITSTNGGNTTFLPVLEPALVAPLGEHLLVESRAAIVGTIFPRPHTGYDHDTFIGLTYLQADVIASRHLTIVAGDFLTPFATYNERLTPIWIGNFQSGPLIYSLGTMSTGSSVGGMLRGSAYSNDHVNIDYAAYFSAASTNLQFSAERSSGGRVSVYMPKSRLEVGASFNRLLQNTQENYSGVHLWWEPADTHLKIRSEWARGPHAHGYWVETAYRLASFGGEESFLGRFEPVFRMQQTFRSQPDSEDGLPSANTQQADFALNYHLPHDVRIDTSYSRQFSSTGDRNIWQTGLVYRFQFPAWRGK